VLVLLSWVGSGVRKGVGAEPASSLPPVSQADLEQKKAAIIAKNIFRPARRPPPVPRLPVSGLGRPETGPRPLKRPFVIQGITHRADDAWVDLRFESPSENRRVRVGDMIESIRIVKIGPSYVECDYAGRKVWLVVGEGSDDALAQVRGFGRDYDLIATTVQGKLRYASILIKGQNRLRRVVEGDKLGDAVIVRIEPGRVYLRYEDGFEHYIEPTSKSAKP